MSRSATPSENDHYAKAMEFAQSTQGQQLMQQLKQSNSPLLRQALSQAASGDMDQLKSTVQKLLNSDEGKSLLRQIGGERRE